MQNINSRPELRLEKTWIDWLLIGVGTAIVIINLLIVIYYYPDLPTRIPMHFNAKGEPDSWGEKTAVWLPLVINITLSWFVYWLASKPHWLNYPYEITTENARSAYTRMARALRAIGLSLIVLMSYISLNGLRVAYGLVSGIGTWLVPVLILSAGMLMAFMLYRKKS